VEDVPDGDAEALRQPVAVEHPVALAEADPAQLVALADGARADREFVGAGAGGREEQAERWQEGHTIHERAPGHDRAGAAGCQMTRYARAMRAALAVLLCACGAAPARPAPAPPV